MVKLAAMSIRLGEIDAAIVGGANSFSREPILLRGLRFQGHRLGHVQLEDPLLALGYKDFNPVAVDCDNLATEYHIGRQEVDEWALRSHINYGNAWRAGKFKDEIMTMVVTQEEGEPKVLDIDEQYRQDISLERLSKLKTIYGTRAITAGNSPGLNDGAAAILLMSRKKAREIGIEPLSVVLAYASTALLSFCGGSFYCFFCGFFCGAL